MEDKVVCDHAELCTQHLVSCLHSKGHVIERYACLKCTDNGYCSVAEVNCMCIGVKV